MATISITMRGTASGRRYDVRYRLGGRTYPAVRAGTFKTENQVKARRDLVAGEIAHGPNPADLLAALPNAIDQPFVSLETWGEAVPRLPHRRRRLGSRPLPLRSRASSRARASR